jgi:hypothetical protein
MWIAIDYPVLRKEWFRDWPSFRWEEPLFWWFIASAILLGVAVALILHLSPLKAKLASLSWTGESQHK